MLAAIRSAAVHGVDAYDVTVAQLRAWNGLKSTRLGVGDRLTIRVAGTRAAQ